MVIRTVVDSIKDMDKNYMEAEGYQLSKGSGFTPNLDTLLRLMKPLGAQEEKMLAGNRFSANIFSSIGAELLNLYSDSIKGVVAA